MKNEKTAHDFLCFYEKKTLTFKSHKKRNTFFGKKLKREMNYVFFI